jgi:hypothetical protein
MFSQLTLSHGLPSSLVTGSAGTDQTHPSNRSGSENDASDRMVAHLDPITLRPCHHPYTSSMVVQRLLTSALDLHRDNLRYNLRC